MKKCIIFDAMGVIFEVGDDNNELLIPYIHSFNSCFSAEFINEKYLQASLGKISSKEFWDEVGLGDRYPDIETDYLEKEVTINKDFIKVARELKQKKYGLAILSNDVSEWSYHLRRKFQLEDLFDYVVISGDVGYRKPDYDIYRILLSKISDKFNDYIFIDDKYSNLVPAQNLGMKTIKFETSKSIHDDKGTYSGYIIHGFDELTQIINLLN